MTQKMIFQFTVLLLGLLLAGCTGKPSDESSNGPDTRSEAAVDPLPRIVDNAPGENHFDTLVQLTDGGVNRSPVFWDNDRRVGFTSVRPPYEEVRNFSMFVDASGLELLPEELPKPLKEATSARTGKPIRCLMALAGTGGKGVFPGAFPHSKGFSTEVLVSVDGGEPKVVSGNGQVAGSPTLTPDGRYVVYSGESSEGEYDLYVHDLELEITEKITTAYGFDGDPAFSADGRRMVFVSQRNDQDPDEYNLFVADWLLIQEE